MAVRIHHIAFSKDQLSKIPESERNLFVLLAHSANEVNVLAKLFHYCAGDDSEETMLQKAQHTQLLLLGRLLTGKIYEFWNLLQAGYFKSALSRSYHGELDDEGRTALDAMSRYFGRDNLIARVRNGHAFHYDVQQIEHGFRTVVEGDALDIYLSEANANSLYAFADTIAGRAMLEDICSGDPQKAFNLLISETSRAVGWINVVTGALMMTCLKRHVGDSFYSLGARTIDLEGAPSSQVVSIPYFIEVPLSKDG